MIKLIVGLGNPGLEYAQTRHNVGFWLLDDLARQWNISFKTDKKFFAELAKVKIQTEEIYLIKPNTYMNRSGQAVAAIANYYKINPAQILVVHDELDIECGRIKFKLGGGNGGHNGLKDIQAHLASADFYRLRLGIGHPGNKAEVTHYVLKRPSLAELPLILAAVEKSVDNITDIIAGRFDEVQRIFHSKLLF